MKKKIRYAALIQKSGTFQDFERACNAAMCDGTITRDEYEAAVKKYHRELDEALREQQELWQTKGKDFATMEWVDFVERQPTVDGRYMIQDWLGIVTTDRWYVECGWSLHRPAAVVKWFDFLPPLLPELPEAEKTRRSALLDMCQDTEIQTMRKLYSTFNTRGSPDNDCKT